MVTLSEHETGIVKDSLEDVGDEKNNDSKVNEKKDKEKNSALIKGNVLMLLPI